MVAVFRHVATLLALVAVGAMSVAGLEGQAGADAPGTRMSADATHRCAQSMPAAEGLATSPWHCPSAPMASAAPCGGAVALPVGLRMQPSDLSTVESIRLDWEDARVLLLVAPLFGPPIA